MTVVMPYRHVTVFGARPPRGASRWRFRPSSSACGATMPRLWRVPRCSRGSFGCPFWSCNAPCPIGAVVMATRGVAYCSRVNDALRTVGVVAHYSPCSGLWGRVGRVWSRAKRQAGEICKARPKDGPESRPMGLERVFIMRLSLRQAHSLGSCVYSYTFVKRSISFGDARILETSHLENDAMRNAMKSRIFATFFVFMSA